MSTGPCGQECHSHDHSKCNHTNDDKESEAQIIGDSLLSYVDLPRVRCLNVADADSVEGIFKTYDRRRDTTEFIESDADDELLLYVPFTEVVKIKGLTIVGGTEASDSSAPSKATLFINRDDLDFDSAPDAQSVQEIDLLDGALSDTEYPLKYAQLSFRALSLSTPRHQRKNAKTHTHTHTGRRSSPPFAT